MTRLASTRAVRRSPVSMSAAPSWSRAFLDEDTNDAICITHSGALGCKALGRTDRESTDGICDSPSPTAAADRLRLNEPVFLDELLLCHDRSRCMLRIVSAFSSAASLYWSRSRRSRSISLSAHS